MSIESLSMAKAINLGLRASMQADEKVRSEEHTSELQSQR